MRTRLVAKLFAVLSLTFSTNAFATPREVTVTGIRVHVRDLVPGAESGVADVDLGPAPIAGASRLISRADILTAVAGHPAPSAVPEMVRVVRKTRHVTPPEMDAIVRASLPPESLRAGVSLGAVHSDRAVEIADGWTHVDVATPRTPKKVGPFATSAIVTFFDDAQVLARIPVPVTLTVSAEGAAFDSPHGRPLTLVVRRSLVEVRVSARAGADADIGDLLPVQVPLSGRTLRARLVSKDEALALE
jgi:hypothetical protein